MSPASSLFTMSSVGIAGAVGLMLWRRLLSPLRFVQIVGGLGSGLVIAAAATRLLAGGGHG